MTQSAILQAPVDPAMEARRLYQRAFHHYRAGRREAAEAELVETLRRDPQHAKAWLLKAVVHDRAAPAVSIALLEHALRIDPADAEVWYNLGVFEGERNALELALCAYERAVQFDPLHIDALNNGSQLLRRFERFEEALAWADRQLELQPSNWCAHLNRAISLFHLRAFEPAERAFRVAMAESAEAAIVVWEFFPLLLMQRRFEEAWSCFERRFACGEQNGVFHYPFAHPLWRGEPLSGRALLVHNEQGLGDQMMYACALEQVIAEADTVTLVVAPGLQELFQASFPEARVLTARMGRFPGDSPTPDWLPELGEIDFQIPIGGLMALRRSDPAAFADPKPYLQPGAEAAKRWKAWAAKAMPAAQGPRIGVCWAANPALFRFDSRRRGVRKSMQLDDLEPLGSVPGVQWVSVLNWSIESMPSAFEGKLLDASGALTTLEETAALISQLDLVITVDTAVAHLAGAMGKPVWLLLHDFPDCRWGLSEDRSYWYPHARLFRQLRPSDWSSVVAEVAEALAGWVVAATRPLPPKRRTVKGRKTDV